MPAMSVEKYKVPAPLNESNPEECKLALQNAYAQLTHMESRTLNLELFHKYGPASWREHIKETDVLCAQ